MRKLKLLLSTLILVLGGALSTNAQTDVTDNVLTSKTAWCCSGTYTVSGKTLAERYYDAALLPAGDVIKQYVKGLDNGSYTVVVYAYSNWIADRGNVKDNAGGVTVGATDFVSFFANSSSTPIKSNTNSGESATLDTYEYTIENAVVYNGVLTIGLRNEKPGCIWYGIQIKSLTYNGEVTAHYKSLLNSVISEATAASITTTAAQATYDNGSATNDEIRKQIIALKSAINAKVVAGATKSAPVEAFLENKGMDNTCFPWASNTDASNYRSHDGADALNNDASITKPYLESYKGGGQKGQIYQMITDVPNGKYTFGLSVFARNSTGGGTEKVYANSYTTDVTQAAAKAYECTAYVTNNNIEVGVDIQGSNIDWAGIDNGVLKYYGPTIEGEATEFTTGSTVTAGQWYYFDVTATGDYKFTTTDALSNIIYTTDGTTLIEDEATVTTHPSAISALTLGRIYFKASADATLEIAPNVFTYTVGSPTLSVADGKYTQSKTFTATFESATTNDPDGTFQILDANKIKVGSTKATATLTDKVLTITLADALTALTDYEISIEAGAVGYKADAANAAISLTVKTPAVFDGTYYLYDETNKRFLSRGANYGTRATVDLYGIPFNVTTNAENASLISFLDWSDTYMFFDNTNHSSCWIYTDGAASKDDDRLFTFEATTGGYYLRDAAKAVYVKHDNSVLTVPTTVEGEATKWTLKSNTEYNAIVAQYATDNKNSVITSASLTTTAAEFDTYLTDNFAAKDKTSKIVMPKFTSDKDADEAAWPFTSVRNDGDINYGTDFAEAFRKSGSFAQTITGLDEGIYKVTVNAFERINGYEVCNSMGGNGWEPVTASFEANGEKVRLASWYSDKIGTNNPDNTGEAATAFNNDKYKIVLYTYVSNNGELELRINKPSFAWSSWVLFNNVTLTFYKALTDQDKLDIIAEAEAEMAKPMKPSLYQALSSAKTTFEGSQTVPNYNALRTAIENTATSVASYAAMNTNYLEPITALLASSNIIDQTSSAYTDYVAYKAKYDNYTVSTTADIENADANALTIWQGNGARYTNIANILMATGWKIGGADALTNNSGFYANVWSTENEGTAPAKDFARPFYEMWVSSGSIAANTLTKTITGLTANAVYSVSANVRVQGNDKVDGSITLKAGEGTAIDVTAGSKIGSTSRYIGAYTAYGQADADGKLTITITIAADSKVSWLAFRDVKYVAVDAADIAQTDDYNNLTTAINTAEGKTLGFENGEYAPYNNAVALEALAAAKAIDQTAINMKATVSAATTALTSATWTANAADVECVYNGNFAEVLTGWTCSSWGQQFTDVPNTIAEGITTAYRYNPGSLQYGNTGIYSMPLKANTVYQLKYYYGALDQNVTPTVSVLNSTDGMAAMSFTATSTNYKTSMNSIDMVFVTGAAGNYVLAIAGDKNLVVTGVSIKKAANQYLEFADGTPLPKYAPSTYPMVKITRTLAAGKWATAVYPFAVSGVDNIAVLNSYDKTTGTLSFTSAASSEANKPFLMRSTAGVTEISLNNVAVAAAAATDVTKSEATLKGVYTATTVDNSAKNYVLKDNKIYSIGANNATVNPYRAYIQVAQDTSAPLYFTVDGETTGIGTTLNEKGQMTNDKVVYDLQGRKVTKPMKGMYIQNGRKVVIK